MTLTSLGLPSDYKGQLEAEVGAGDFLLCEYYDDHICMYSQRFA